VSIDAQVQYSPVLAQKSKVLPHLVELLDSERLLGCLPL
jgi:hypothetical protein